MTDRLLILCSFDMACPSLVRTTMRNQCRALIIALTCASCSPADNPDQMEAPSASATLADTPYTFCDCDGTCFDGTLVTPTGTGDSRVAAIAKCMENVASQCADHGSVKKSSIVQCERSG